MKTFLANYFESFNYGAYVEYDFVVAANDENEALGLALESQTDTKAKYWTITEIDLSTPTAIYVHSHRT